MEVKNSYTPCLRTGDDIKTVMFDVILALTPAILISILVYGLSSFLIILICILSAVLTETIFSKIFFNEISSIKNLSAIVTGILLAFILAPYTPIYVAAFGAAMAIIFGKLIFGGIGKNRLNPAVVGREFMTVFFPLIMSSPAIWSGNSLNISELKIFSFIIDNNLTNYLDKLLINPTGSIGEVSILALIAGGTYLLIKNRISWHIPVALFCTVFLVSSFVKEAEISMGGLMLVGIFMATDTPTSPTYSFGKFYYGMMMGLTMAIFWKFGIQSETLSYSIIVLNIFSKKINKVFRPVVSGYKLNLIKKIFSFLKISILIFLFDLLWILLHKFDIIPYIVFIYILVTTVKLISSKNIK
ncbi:RnfABCDGE type electron transport complex subunit D [Leptotrichia sp. oral taxon 847]|uniref:RnfABCDGE type electron transport complex subunit D n=1 Tax=Leptotrichia sp. oral taxon 847 TaxID=1785996 RepID=UPI0009E8D7F5|nr:RnfABCDGE type electron transport complex subunit D [Leptotrichia sp. oral taxon 847]